jgi:proteasome activator subunit 4
MFCVPCGPPRCLHVWTTQALRHRVTLLDVIRILQEKTLSERGYSATGRMVHRLLLTLSTVYPRYGRFVNTDEWESIGANVAIDARVI